MVIYTAGSSLLTSHSFYNTFHLPVLMCCIMGACLLTTLPFSYFSSYWIFPSANQFLISEVASDAFFFFFFMVETPFSIQCSILSLGYPQYLAWLIFSCKLPVLIASTWGQQQQLRDAMPEGGGPGSGEEGLSFLSLLLVFLTSGLVEERPHRALQSQVSTAASLFCCSTYSCVYLELCCFPLSSFPYFFLFSSFS